MAVGQVGPGVVATGSVVVGVVAGVVVGSVPTSGGLPAPRRGRWPCARAFVATIRALRCLAPTAGPAPRTAPATAAASRIDRPGPGMHQEHRMVGGRT